MATDERSEPSASDLEEIVAELVAEKDPDAALAEACAAHPAWADRIASSVAALRRLGLLAEPVAARAARDSIAGFRMLEVLGRGGMGVVYRAIDAELGREVALKVLRPELLHFDDSRARFQREIESASRLRHPGIVSVYSAGEDDGVPFFTMELVEGRALSSSIQALRGQPFGLRRGADLLGVAVSEGSGSQTGTGNLADNWLRACLQVIRMVAEALQHAHENGVVHRDVKPANILVDVHGRARLLDFGLARLESAQQLTKSSSLLGSLPYMPPELVDARLDTPGARQDVYSLAVTLYELLSLRQPFLADSSEETRRRVVAGEYSSLRKLEPSIGRECEIVCQKGMDQDPSRRYASAREFADDLDNLLMRRPILAKPAGPILRSLRLAQRHPTGSVAIALSMLVVLASVYAMFSTMRSRDLERQAMRQLVDSNLDFVFKFAQGLQSIPGSMDLRVKLLRQAADQLLQLESNRDLDPARLGKIGEAHIALAEVLGRPNKTNIGERATAEERYQHVLEELVPRLAIANAAGAALLNSRAALGLAAILRFGGEYDSAIEVLDTAAEGISGHLVDAPESNLEKVLESQYLHVQSQLASIAGSQGRHDEALSGFEAVRERRRLQAEHNPGDSQAQLLLASASADVAVPLYMLGDATGAAAEYRSYIDLLEVGLAQRPGDAQLAFQRLRRGVPFVEILIAAKELEEAIAQGQQLIELCDRLAAADPDNANFPGFRLATTYNIGWAYQERAELAIHSGGAAEEEQVLADLNEALLWFGQARDEFRAAAAAGRLDASVQEERLSGRIETVRGLLGER